MSTLLLLVLPTGASAASERAIATRPAPHPQPATLCTASERVVLSFRVAASGKTSSICEGRGQSFLVYRFGSKGRIELAHPRILNSSSWRQFEFAGYSRGGGARNDAMGEYSLTFTNANVRYIVYQRWRVATHDYGIGVTVLRPDKKRVSFEGDPSTQVGALSLLEQNPKLLPLGQ